jgi:diadenosine tetraphosphate (Ap4A) HIT family hydrolase
LGIDVMSFTLYPQLAADTLVVGDLPLCRVLLMNNFHFPWLILVPRREGLRELFDLGAEYAAVMEEVRAVAAAFGGFLGADKMNVATLGNVVEQLHIHVIARFRSDAAWPAPVWNSAQKAELYGAEKGAALCAEIRGILGIS